MIASFFGILLLSFLFLLAFFMRIKIFGLLIPLCLSFCWLARQSLTGSKFPSNPLVGSHWPSFSSSMLVWFHSQPIYSCRLDLVVGWTLFFKEVLLCLFRSTLLDTFLKRTHSGCSFPSWLLSCALRFSEENPFRVLPFQLAVELCSTLFWREPIQGAPFPVGCWVVLCTFLKRTHSGCSFSSWLFSCKSNYEVGCKSG